MLRFNIAWLYEHSIEWQEIVSKSQLQVINQFNLNTLFPSNQVKQTHNQSFIFNSFLDSQYSSSKALLSKFVSLPTKTLLLCVLLSLLSSNNDNHFTFSQVNKHWYFVYNFLSNSNFTICFVRFNQTPFFMQKNKQFWSTFEMIYFLKL